MIAEFVSELHVLNIRDDVRKVPDMNVDEVQGISDYVTADQFPFNVYIYFIL